MNRVSVIIPNYNRETLIGATIQNMLNQTLPPHEVIVVDDGSSDRSIAVIRSFGSRVKLIQQSNQGPGAARNAGLAIATGDYVQFMDSDDLASLNKLEVQSRYLSQNQSDIVYGPWAKVWLKNKRLTLQDMVLQQKPLPASRAPLLWFLTSWSMVFQQCLVRRSFLTEVGGYREDIRIYEDGELFVRLLLAKANIIHEGETLTLYRLHNHGKLTETGVNLKQNAIAQAKFYLSVVQLCKKSPIYLNLIHHPEFQLNVWNAWIDLNMSGAIDDPQIQSFDTLLMEKNIISMRLKKWFSQTRKGIQRRLVGHRWPACYTPGKASLYQKNLMEELGFLS
jgi:glycosyltransferase involved in cell wall biosynthesis